MEANARPPRIIVLAPAPAAKGGISAVVRNYANTPFWHDYGCTHFATTTDIDRPLEKLCYELLRLATFVLQPAIRGRPGAVSIHAASDRSFYRKFCYLMVSRLFMIPAVLHVHPASFADFYRHGGPIRRFTVRLAGRLSDRIVVLSADIRSGLVEAFPEAKMAVLPNPVDVRQYTAEPAPPRDLPPRVLFLGWIIREKGVYDLVDAIPEVLEAYPDTLFAFAGHKEVAELRDRIASKGLADSATVLGWVEGERKIDLLRRSTILVLPSYTEGVPNVLLEAMASRLPIITTAVGGIPSILAHDDSALFVEPGNPRSIAAAIKTLLGDPDKRRSLAQRAFDRAAREFGLDVIGRELTRIYSRYFEHASAAK